MTAQETPLQNILGAINYNTVWTSIFEPASTFGFLERYHVRRRRPGMAMTLERL